jgi:hypothetical protein
MNPFQNFDPNASLVTVIITAHEGDISYLPRAVCSVIAQDMPHDQVDVALAYDGPMSEPSADIARAAAAELVAAGFPDGLKVYELQKPTGYYCAPRNMATVCTNGYYIANLDVDNEFAPTHLSGLLTAIRIPRPNGAGWPHFVYSRTLYVRDPDCTTERELPEGEDAFVPWTPENLAPLMAGPQGNFIDTSCLLVGRSVYYALAERTGLMWNTECTRFGDWELVRRMAQIGIRGYGVDQLTNIYHWTGKNVQLNRPVSDLVALPKGVYDKMVEEGKIVVN